MQRWMLFVHIQKRIGGALVIVNALLVLAVVLAYKITARAIIIKILLRGVNEVFCTETKL
jgi:hypothetical protein